MVGRGPDQRTRVHRCTTFPWRPVRPGLGQDGPRSFEVSDNPRSLFPPTNALSSQPITALPHTPWEIHALTACDKVDDG
ncbi:hypothetical protein IG631_00743 [Alternaria alternata]|nr:hypothetical protein IG631_00743 [Alternaria alternata]